MRDSVSMVRKLFLILSIGLFLSGSILLLFPERAAFRRQKEEEEIAENFISRDISAQIPTKTDKLQIFQKKAGKIRRKVEKLLHFEEKVETNALEDTGVSEEVLPVDIADDVYYQRGGVTYTPDYAEGCLQCVLHIPKETVSICRGVYSGTWEEIEHDLDIWMVTSARPNYILGETHYVIYGHNHPVQNLSFNRLQEMAVGDEFTLTTEGKIYIYEVTRVYGMSRERVASEITDNFSLPKENCYIVTCGRGKYSGLDFVVEGRLKERREKHE